MALVLLFFDDDVAGVPAELLIPGRYRLGLVVGIAGRRHVQEVYPPLEIDVVQDRLVANVWSGHVGVVTPRCEWKLMDA